MDFRQHTVVSLADQVRSRQLGARELVGAALDRIVAHDPTVRAFVATDPERSLAQADALDARIAAGEDPGPLAGIPVGVKDLEDAEGYVTTYGSAFHAEDPPAAGDSPLVARLRAAGAIVVGKTATCEWGHTADTVGPLHPGALTPWNLERTAGGSSGGSGAALAAGLVPLCTGSDGGGSIRIPAAIGGLPGFKPSHGRVPMGGAHSPGSGLASVKGPMTRTVEDLVRVLDCVVGPEPSDLFSLPAPHEPWAGVLTDVGAPARVLWAPDWGYEVDDEVRTVLAAAVDRLADSGTEIIPLDRVLDPDPVVPWFLMWTVNIWRLNEERYGTPDWERLTPSLREQLEVGRTVSAATFARSLDGADAANLQLIGHFHRAPLLLCPVLAGRPGPPGGLGTVNGSDTIEWVRFTYPFNLTRNPAGTVPCGATSDGIPVGLQVVGPQHADVAVLRAMAHLSTLFGGTPVAPGLDD